MSRDQIRAGVGVEVGFGVVFGARAMVSVLVGV